MSQTQISIATGFWLQVIIMLGAVAVTHFNVDKRVSVLENQVATIAENQAKSYQRLEKAMDKLSVRMDRLTEKLSNLEPR